MGTITVVNDTSGNISVRVSGWQNIGRDSGFANMGRGERLEWERDHWEVIFYAKGDAASGMEISTVLGMPGDTIHIRELEGVVVSSLLDRFNGSITNVVGRKPQRQQHSTISALLPVTSTSPNQGSSVNCIKITEQPVLRMSCHGWWGVTHVTVSTTKGDQSSSQPTEGCDVLPTQASGN
jgi:hypothetical protein